MPPRIPIASLLTGNFQTPENLDQQAAIAELRDQALLSDAPPLVIESLTHVANYFGSTQESIGSVAHPSRRSVLPLADNMNHMIQPPTICRNVYSSSRTTLSILYTYEDVNAWVEYPETSPDQPVGYLFRRDPRNWENPVQNFAYSLGKPSGQTKRGQERENHLLVDQHGNKVPCVVSHLTCTSSFRSRFLLLLVIYCAETLNLPGQGSKVCPMSDQQSMESAHTSAGREDITARLHRDRQHRLDTASPSRDIFQKTTAFISALQHLGCRGPMYEPTLFSGREKELRDFLAQHKAKIQRGSSSQQPTCDGRLELFYGYADAKPYIQYAHHLIYIASL
jgi:hypothetical protein